VSQALVKLNTALGLPKMVGGYMSEKTLGSEFRGITFGISVPLWESRNTVKYARAHTLAMLSVEEDSRLQFYNNLKLLHSRAIALSVSLEDYRDKLRLFSNADLLKAALEERFHLLSISSNFQSTMKVLITCSKWNET
jgi:hypothetical protein